MDNIWSSIMAQLLGVMVGHYSFLFRLKGLYHIKTELGK